MKSIRLITLLVAFFTAYSCSDSDPIQDNPEAQRSIALRTVLNELKSANNIQNRDIAPEPFCFDFVFPITFSYNNGATVTATGFEGLIEILLNESSDHYIEAVVFPFQVTHNGAQQTIHNEDEFAALVESCGIVTYNDDLENSFCFDIVFPIQVQLEGQVITVANMQELLALLDTPAAANGPQIVFPISVLYLNQTVVIHNLYEFYEMTNNCDGCVCTLEYAPVCVTLADGTIVEYGNACFAICAGFSQTDFMNCSTSGCFLNNLSVTVGDCNNDMTYAVTIDFDHQNTTSDHFEVYDTFGNQVGVYTFSQLPLTLAHYPASSNGVDAITITVSGSNNCTVSTQWQTPSCGCNCPTDINPVCVQTPTGVVQFENECYAVCAGFSTGDFVPCVTPSYNFGELLGTCFTVQYPVNVQYQGAIVSVTSDGQLLQYWFPANHPMPAFHYPIDVVFSGVTYTFANQEQFETLISSSCF